MPNQPIMPTATTSVAADPAEENARLNTREYAEGRTRLASLPRSMWLAFTAKCNLACYHCPRGKKYVRDEDAPEIEPELFDRVEAELLPTMQRVVLGGNNLGEQLTYREFDAYFDRLAAHAARIEFVTNATIMPPDRIERIVDRGVVFLISTEGTGATYEALRGRSWDTIEATIRAIDAARRARPGNTTRIALGVTIFATNLGELERCIRLKSIGVDIVMVHHISPHEESQRYQSLAYHRGEANAAFDRARALATELDVELHIPENFPVGAIAYDRATAGRTAPPEAAIDYAARPCDLPWTATSIDESGNVMPCCASQMVLGNLRTHTFTEIWNGPKYVRLRATVNSTRPLHDCRYCPTRIGNDPAGLLRAIDPPAGAPLLLRLGRSIQRALRARGHDRLATLGRRLYRRLAV